MIRKMEVKDLEVVTQIEKDNFNEAYQTAQFQYELEDNPCAYLYVLEEEGKLVGYVDYWITFDSCQLCKIAIVEEKKHQGYGEQLMEFMFREAEEQDCEAILLEVRESNKRAISFYEFFDFLEISKRKGYYNNPKEDGIVMGKVLLGE